jgi:hypothetical protein
LRPLEAWIGGGPMPWIGSSPASLCWSSIRGRRSRAEGELPDGRDDGGGDVFGRRIDGQHLTHPELAQTSGGAVVVRLDEDDDRNAGKLQPGQRLAAQEAQVGGEHGGPPLTRGGRSQQFGKVGAPTCENDSAPGPVQAGGEHGLPAAGHSRQDRYGCGHEPAPRTVASTGTRVMRASLSTASMTLGKRSGPSRIWAAMVVELPRAPWPVDRPAT